MISSRIIYFIFDLKKSYFNKVKKLITFKFRISCKNILKSDGTIK
jgi:hypothetical protein